MQAGAQAEELLELIRITWGEERATEVQAAADALSAAMGDPRGMTRNYHVYLAAGIPMPSYARDEFVWFLRTKTEKKAGRKMTPEVRDWLEDALTRLRGLPRPPDEARRG